MNRRKFIQSVGVGLAATTWGAAESVSTTKRPNILFLLSDDHSAPFLGCYGYPIQTPNFDRFASQGMRFDRMFVSAPQCVPSRAALMTGRSPVAVRTTRFTSPLPPDIITLPEILRTEGYYTGICRRTFHLDGAAKANGLTEGMYDRYGMRTFDRRVDYLDRKSERNQTKNKMNEFLDRVPDGKPFFLWISFNDPHHRWDENAIPKPHVPAALNLLPCWPDMPGMRKDLGRYCDEIGRLDEEFQWVLDILEARRLSGNTVVVFLGDNGMAFPHGKGSLYDPGLNVAMLVRWPGVVGPGTRTRELISGEDLAPTLLEAAGMPVHKEMSGKSFLRLLRGEPHEERQYVFAERGVHGSSTFNENTKADGLDFSRCVRSKKYKLIYNVTPYQVYQPVDSSREASWREIVAAHEAGTLAPEFDRAYFSHPRPIYELFDLDKDPGELNNLAGKPEYGAVMRDLQIALQEKMSLDYDYLPLPLNE